LKIVPVVGEPGIVVVMISEGFRGIWRSKLGLVPIKFT
jgi:hypothetical protein